MGEIPIDLIRLIYQLLPGFIVAWVIYGLTTFAKPKPFERIVQAIIFSFFVNCLLIVCKEVLFLIGTYYYIGFWNDDVNLIWSVICAVFIGIIFSACINSDFPHVLLRCGNYEKWWWFFRPLAKSLRIGWLTRKNILPSGWYAAFSNLDTNFVVLNLKNGNRIIGQLSHYPDDETKGHFILEEPRWLDLDSTEIESETSHRFIVDVRQVNFIEFLKQDAND